MAGEEQSFIDEKVIQRMLFLATDIIAEKNNKNDVNFITLSASIDKDGPTSANQESIILINQQKLFSEAILSSGSAVELYSDAVADDSIENEYIIENEISLFLPNDNGDAYENWYFNIDEANKNEGKFLISKINIKNKPKDSFTLKANYQISLKINFSSFDDLYGKYITAKKVGEPTVTKKIPIISLLNKFFDDKGKNKTKDIAADTTGIFLSQKLILNPKFQKFKKFIEFSGTNIVQKNYHLTYKNHSFDVFKDDNPFYKYYENELSIEYTSFELQRNKQNNEKIPTTSGNLYNLISDEKIFKDAQYGINEIQKIVDNLKKCQIAEINIPNDDLEKINKKIEEYQKNLLYTGREINLQLLYKILSELKYFSIEVPYSTINVYKESISSEQLTLNMPSILGTGIIGVGLIGSTFLGGPLLLALGGAALLGSTSYLAVSASLSNKLVSNGLNYSSVRSSIKNSNVSVESGIKEKYKSQIELDVTTDSSGKLNIEIGNQESEKKLDYEFKKINGTELKSKDQLQQKQKIYFTTFGQILNLLKHPLISSKFNIISGGYVAQTTEGLKYINFKDIPISVKTLANFLFKAIIRTERNFQYDSEVFLRDIYENIIKNTLYDGATYLSNLEMYVSKDIKVNSTIHSIPQKYGELLGTQKINLLEQKKFDLFLKNFLNSKKVDFGQHSSNFLWKIYTFGSYEEIRYNDFYKKYDDKNNNRNPKNYSTLEFQKFISENYSIPCILIEKLSTRETILKKKYVKFSKIDNPYITAGNFQSQTAITRLPYKMNVDLKSIMSFFVNPGTYIFVAPPYMSSVPVNTYGFGGLYSVLGSELEYNFQKIQDLKLTIPNFDSKYSIEATHISFGDAIPLVNKAQNEINKYKADCNKFIKNYTQ